MGIDIPSIDEYHEVYTCGGHMRLCIFSLSFSILLCSGCKRPPSEPENFLTTGHDFTVHIYQTDDFYRQQVFQGPALLSLILNSGTLQISITTGAPAYTFHNVPDGPYILRLQKDGYFPAEVANLPQVTIYEIPPLSSRITKIECSIKAIYYNVTVTTLDTVPSGFIRQLAAFVGMSPNVSPTPGTYFGDNWGEEDQGQTVGSVAIQANPPIASLSGSTVYLTARIMCGATQYFQDNTHNVLVFTNLDQNPPVVLPFKIP